MKILLILIMTVVAIGACAIGAALFVIFTVRRNINNAEEDFFEPNI